MGKRSLKQQLTYAIMQADKTGQSKHSAKAAGTYKAGELYGYNTIAAYLDTAKNLSNFMKENFPDIKKVVDITPEHIDKWIEARAVNWTEKTLENHLTRIKYIQEQSRSVFGKKVNFYDPNRDYKKIETQKSTRDVAMSRDDFNRLEKSMEGSKSYAKDVIEITARCGLRVNECVCLKREDIDLKKNLIHVSREGAKNGRERWVPIREKDRDYFKELLEKNPDNGYLCKISKNSVCKAIRRYMAETKDKDGRLLSEKYVNTADHAIRKMYATERMQEERGASPLDDKKEEMRHWDKVCAELGHGEGRGNLYKTYCKS